jgi:hypothetical protein
MSYESLFSNTQHPSPHLRPFFFPCNTSHSLLILRQRLVNTTQPAATANDVSLQTQLDAIDTVSRLFDFDSDVSRAADVAAAQDSFHQHQLLSLNVQSQVYLAEIALLKHSLMLAEAKAAAAEARLVEMNGGGASNSVSFTDIVKLPPPPPPITTSPPNGKVVANPSLSNLALPPDQLQYYP